MTIMHEQSINQKPLIIINCSRQKATSKCKPIDMYCGKSSLSTLVRSNADCVEIYKYDLHAGCRDTYSIPKLSDIADVYILSAELGLINAYGDEIDPYNKVLSDGGGEDEIPVSDFVKANKKATRLTLKDLNITNRTVYVCMVGIYLNAFRQMAGTLLKEVTNLYISEEIMGIGDLRGRLSKVCKHIAKDFVTDAPQFRVNYKPPTVFRSGVTSANEMAIYDDNHQNIGTSLHYINAEKPICHVDKLISKLRKQHSNKVFLDNGFISNPNIDPSTVFHKYNQIVDLINLWGLQNLSIVIPDNFDAESALNIVTQYKKEILALSEQWVRVILPIHALDTVKGMRKHVTAMLEALDWPQNITAGIPSLPGRDYSLGKIQAVLSIKKPNGELAFNGVHFLGLGDSKARQKKFQQRVLLSQIVGINDISFDSNRSNALWGNKKANKHKGTKIINIFEDELKIAPLLRRVTPSELTKSYDSKIIADFYRDGLTLANVEPAMAVLCKHFPRLSDMLCCSPEETLSNAKATFFWIWRSTWEDIGQELLTDLIELDLLNYDANTEFGYYDKRRISYDILGRVS